MAAQRAIGNGIGATGSPHEPIRCIPVTKNRQSRNRQVVYHRTLVTRLHFISRWFGACIGLLLFTFSSLGVAAANPKRVLILSPFSRDVEPFAAAIGTFRSTLARELGEPVDFHEIPLDLARSTDLQGEESLVVFLDEQIKGQPVDLVVPFGGASVRFVARHRDRLFPETQILVTAAEPRMIPPDFLRSNASLVTQRADLPGMVDDILQMQPDTSQIAVVFGSSPLEKFWAQECRKQFSTFSDRVEFIWLEEFTLEEMLEQCSTLPPRSFVLHVFFLVDAAGIGCEKNEALRSLHEVANAPVFAVFSSEFGQGPVGGRLFQNDEIGAQGARTAARILLGEKAENIPPLILEPATPVYDWRELQRWNIPEDRLPPNRIIRFRQPGFWQRYRWPATGALAFSVLQAALIVGLVANRSRRRQGEAEATLVADISSKFVNLSPGEVDSEIRDAERRLCEFLNLDLVAIWQWSAGPPGVFELTHHHSVDDLPQPNMQVADSDFPWARQLMLDNRIVPVSSLGNLPPEAATDRESCRRMGIKSNLCLPLTVGGEPVGILGLNTIRAERKWPDALVKRLQLVAQIFTNALERKRADQALRASEERTTLATDAAQVGIWGWNFADQQVWGSERWMHLFGLAPGDDLSFDTVMEQIHPDDRGMVEREVQRVLAGGIDYAGEFRTVMPDGSHRWIGARGRALAGAGVKLSQMLGTAIDVTERKRTEEALRTSEARLAAGVELAGLGYYEVDFSDGEGTCFVDERCREICGIPADRQQNLQSLEFWMERLHPVDREVMLEEREKLHAGETNRISLEYRYQHPARGQRWIQHLAGVATRDARGRAVRTFGVVRDITRQRQAEAEAHELRGNLAHADRVTLLGQLASALAHELSQPLGAILRNAETAEIILQSATPDLEDLRAIVTDILYDDQRAGQVIDKLRSLLKKGHLSPQPIDLGDVISEVMSLIRADAATRHVTLHSSIPPGLPMIRGDRIHLQQVLLNLLVNAMDELDGCGSRENTIRISAALATSSMVEVRVADNGPGIPEEFLGSLFDPFFSTKTKGMGMGLTVSKTIVEAHKGTLWAENRPEGGACFCFTIRAEDGKYARTERT